MGTRYVQQGQCKECGVYSHDYCDYCGRYICNDHCHLVHAKHGQKEFIFCKDCYEKGRPPKDPEGFKI